MKEDFLVILTGAEEDMVSHVKDVSFYAYIDGHGYFECRANDHLDALKTVLNAVWDFEQRGTMFVSDQIPVIYAFEYDEEAEPVINYQKTFMVNIKYLSDTLDDISRRLEKLEG